MDILFTMLPEPSVGREFGSRMLCQEGKGYIINHTKEPWVYPAASCTTPIRVVYQGNLKGLLLLLSGWTPREISRAYPTRGHWPIGKRSVRGAFNCLSFSVIRLLWKHWGFDGKYLSVSVSTCQNFPPFHRVWISHPFSGPKCGRYSAFYVSQNSNALINADLSGLLTDTQGAEPPPYGCLLIRL